MSNKFYLLLKDRLSFISTVLTILSLIISFVLLIKINTIYDWVDQTVDPLDLNIFIDQPRNDSLCFDHDILITGRIELGCKRFKSSKIGTELRKRNVAIVPLVQPLSIYNKIYPQPELIIDDNGNFSGIIQLGDEKNGINVKYIIRVVAVHSNLIKNPKDYASSSESVIVHRVDRSNFTK